MATTPEGAVKTAIKKYLTSIGAWFFMPIGGPYSTAGIPDLIVCWNGHLIGIECKAPGKKKTATPLQLIQLQKIRDAGGITILADCVEDVVAVFNDLIVSAATRTAHANKSVREIS